MVKHLLFALFGLFLISGTKADTVVTIGDKAVIINDSTSCAIKSWGNNQANACGCCLTKQKMTTKKPADEVVRICIKDKYCTLPILAQWDPGETDPDDIVTNVLWNTVDSPTISVNPAFLDKKGKLLPTKFIEFLGSLRKDLRDLNEPMLTDFSRPTCLEAQSLQSSGANTLQLFLVMVNEKCIQGQRTADNFKPKYIIKDTKKKTEEIRNLRQLHQSELRTIYDLLSRNRPKDSLAISFDILNIKYKYNNSNHYLSFLSVAPGKSFMSISKLLAASIRKGDSAAVHRDSDALYKSSYSLGKGLGELHRRFMDTGKGTALMGNSIVHGDLHLENIYVDLLQNFLITLIDNESFAKSLKQKRPVAVDLFVLYAFTVSQFKGQYAYPKEISLTMWNNLMLKPFLLGYISNWPPTQRTQLINELKAIYLSPTTAIKLLPQRFVFINLISYRAKIKDIKRVFNEISSNE